MPPKIVESTSSASSKRENRTTRRGKQAEETEAPHPPPSTMATQTQTSGYPVGVGFHQMPERVRLPPILPSPTGHAGPRLSPLSTTTSPLTQEHGPHVYPHSPYTPSNIRTPQWSYVSPETAPPTQSTQISSAGRNTVPRGIQPESSIPLKRAYEGFGETPYG